MGLSEAEHPWAAIAADSPQKGVGEHWRAETEDGGKMAEISMQQHPKEPQFPGSINTMFFSSEGSRGQRKDVDVSPLRMTRV